MSGIPSSPVIPLPAGVAQQDNRPSIMPYSGTAASQYGTHQQNLNPMNRREVQLVANAARGRLNNFIRATNPSAKLYQPDEKIPALLLLLEALNFTIEPLRTDALRAMKNMQVPLSTSVAITVQWERSQFQFVPWEVRTVPLWVVIQLINQVKHYVYRIKPDVTVDPTTGKRVVTSIPLEPDERVQIAFLKFRDPNSDELASIDDLSARFNQTITAVQGQHGGQSVLVNLNPTGAAPSTMNGVQVQPSAQPPVVAEGQVQKTSMPPDKRLQAAPATPADAVTDSTVSPDTSPAALRATQPEAQPEAQPAMPTPPGLPK